MTLFLGDAATASIDQVAAIIGEQLAQPYKASDNLRTAVMYCPLTMPSRDFVAACERHGINAGTARNRFNEVRRWQKELGEI